MAWIKNVLLDLVVLAVIAIYAFDPAEWGYWVIAVYTPFMLVLKLGALASGMATAIRGKGADNAPSWFFHLVYAASVLLLLYAEFWWAAAGWMGIWILSAVADARSKPQASKKGT